MSIENNVNLFDLCEDDREAVAKLYGSTPPAYVDIERDKHGGIIRVTREGRIVGRGEQA